VVSRSSTNRLKISTKKILTVLVTGTMNAEVLARRAERIRSFIVDVLEM